MSGKSVLLSLLLLFSSLAVAVDSSAQPHNSGDDQPAISLSELALEADLVAVAQVVDTNYVYTRAFPSEGIAVLKVLISYKANRADEEYVEVYEKGLHPNECYFEDPEFFSEGRRYLVFFRFDADEPELYRGLPQGCALEILVTENNTYALKYPVEGIELKENLDELASALTFRDQHALVQEERLSPARRDDLLNRGLIEAYEDQFKYTHGVGLTAVRRLIGTDALQPKRR
jgi:hypothetical protein